MAYTRVGMDVLPPQLSKDKAFTYQYLNEMIIAAFKKTKLIKKVSCDKNYNLHNKRIYLECSSVDNIEGVQIFDRKGSDLKYSVYSDTGHYCNYIDLDRELEVGESIEITYTGKPNMSDLLKHQQDVVYIKDDVYNTLVNLMYLYIKANAPENIKNKNKSQEKGVKENGKN